jgi:hypothetical protein
LTMVGAPVVTEAGEAAPGGVERAVKHGVRSFVVARSGTEEESGQHRLLVSSIRV